MKKTISFINKTTHHIICAYEKLKMRYKKVEFIISAKGVLCSGYFIVEGVGKRQLKFI